mgnify:CR=1 FL=1
MDDALAPACYRPTRQMCRVLILVVMDDALAQAARELHAIYNSVLILVVMDDALAHKKKIGSKIQKPS